MSRSGYSDDGPDSDEEQRAMNLYRGAVVASIKSSRGQAFLRELLAVLDAMPVKRLIAGSLEEQGGEVCAIGAVGRARGIDMSKLDPENYEGIAATFGIAKALVREIEYENDEESCWLADSPEKRWEHMRMWAAVRIK